MNPTSSFESEIERFDQIRKEEQAEVKASSVQGEMEFEKWYKEYYLVPTWHEQRQMQRELQTELSKLYGITPKSYDEQSCYT